MKILPIVVTLAGCSLGRGSGSTRASLDGLESLDRFRLSEVGPSCKEVNERPIVGILTQPSEPLDRIHGKEYIQASYVKYLESAGLRVVPIRYTADEEELRELSRSLNGILFPGGDTELIPGSQFFETAHKLFKWTVESKENSRNPVPIWGTCLGFELLSILGAGPNITVMEASGRFNSSDVAAPITLNANAYESDILGSMPKAMQEAISTENVTYNAHHNGITPSMFQNNANLSKTFDVLAVYKDLNGKPFVAAIEGKDGLPIYGVQFHPEKSPYSWHQPTNIPHSPMAISIAQYFANFFASQVRCNHNKFKGGERAVWDRIIEKSTKKLVVREESYLTEIYMF